MLYYVQGTDGKFYGPADLPTLNQWAVEGRILADTVLVDQTTNKQTPARNVPGLQHHFQLAPPPPGGPPQPSQPGPQPGQPQGQQYQQYQQPPQYRQPMYMNTSGLPSWMGYRPVNRNQPYYAPRKSKIVAVILAFLIGFLGVHRFYLGYTSTGIAMLLLGLVGGWLLCGIGAMVTGVWAIIDGVMILSDQMPDANGQPLD